MGALDEHVATLTRMPPAQMAAAVQEALEGTKDYPWIPNPGPQTDAYFSKADVLLYGGEPGGGKSQLIIGLAYNAHLRSLIMRRQYGDLNRLVEDTLKVHGSNNGFNGSPPPRLRVSKEKIIDFAAANRVGDEQGQMGKGHDLLGIDEATHFAESQIRFLMGWNRTDTDGQRVRTVLATNPPLTAEGLWVIKMFAPWLDPTYHNPAQPGELRWVISDEEGKDLWVEGPDDIRTINGKEMRPTSRTYIPASVSDNPYYAATDYERQLDAMPEPFRSILMGGFRTAYQDAKNQVIPTPWLQAAQDRWTPHPPIGVPMCGMGVDCSGGGSDPMVIAPRYDGYYPVPIKIEGRDIPKDRPGKYAAGVVVSHRRDRAIVVVDMGGGYGGPLFEQLSENEIECQGHKGAEGSVQRTVEGQLRFKNKRTQVIWRFREALDPSQPGGSPIMLPPSPQMISDLAAPTFKMGTQGIEVESKVDVCDRLGRSTDEGDAVVMAWSAGPTYITDGELWRAAAMEKQHLGRRPRQVMSQGPRLTTRR